MPQQQFAPRALARQTIACELTAFELAILVEALERRAVRAAEDAELIGAADVLFCRIAQLRELMR